MRRNRSIKSSSVDETSSLARSARRSISSATSSEHLAGAVNCNGVTFTFSARQRKLGKRDHWLNPVAKSAKYSSSPQLGNAKHCFRGRRGSKRGMDLSSQVPRFRFPGSSANPPRGDSPTYRLRNYSIYGCCKCKIGEKTSRYLIWNKNDCNRSGHNTSRRLVAPANARLLRRYTQFEDLAAISAVSANEGICCERQAECTF